jgi:hypothetical protein
MACLQQIVGELGGVDPVFGHPFSIALVKVVIFPLEPAADGPCQAVN